MRSVLPMLCLLLLAACNTAPRRSWESRSAPAPGPATVIYVVKRSWHVDIGFAAADLHEPLASVGTAFPGAYYLLFGFGDRRYLLAKGQGLGEMIAALWPGPALVLVTGLTPSPETVFGNSNVIRISVSAAQARALEAFIWKALSKENGSANPLASGPYGGSLYYASDEHYSVFHTCNTWAAEGLRAAGLRVHSFGVEFSGQLWRQVQRVAREASTDASAADAPQGGASLP
jgi:uncharacterized protein (TIGR02117 family)